LEGAEQPKILPKPPGNAFSDALLMARFKVSRLTLQKKTALHARGFLKLRFAWFHLIN
jgi:hypothetical protein